MVQGGYLTYDEIISENFITQVNTIDEKITLIQANPTSESAISEVMFCAIGGLTFTRFLMFQVDRIRVPECAQILANVQGIEGGSEVHNTVESADADGAQLSDLGADDDGFR